MPKYSIAKDAKIYIAGHRGMVGSAIRRKLQKEGFTNIIGRTSAELDLRNQEQVSNYFGNERPEYVFLAAAKVGGILANNTYRAEFIYDNLMIQNNIIHQAHVHDVKKLMFLGSSCIYPKSCPQPMKEEYLLSGYLEPTNEPYAIAKIAGIKMCESYRRQYGSDFISVMPTNLYGPGDNYNLEKSHVIPALLSKFHSAKENGEESVTIWGSGKPLREFMHVDDLAEACYFLMTNYSDEQFVNIASGDEISINDLAIMIKEITGYCGKLNHDLSKPDGTLRKLMDNTKLTKLGWKPNIPLINGLKTVYNQHFKINDIE